MSPSLNQRCKTNPTNPQSWCSNISAGLKYSQYTNITRRLSRIQNPEMLSYTTVSQSLSLHFIGILETYPSFCSCNEWNLIQICSQTDLKSFVNNNALFYRMLASLWKLQSGLFFKTGTSEQRKEYCTALFLYASHIRRFYTGCINYSYYT